MSDGFVSLLLLWPIIGIAGHIYGASKLKTWGRTPIWEEPSTYLMFLPAMILGPLILWMYSE